MTHLISSLVVTWPEPDRLVQVLSLDGRIHALAGPVVANLKEEEDAKRITSGNERHSPNDKD
jgi:hypothetical protein